jgi:hypothetical protein
MFIDKNRYSFINAYREGLSRNDFELKRLGITEEKFLDKTCESFYNTILFNFLSERFSSTLTNKLKMVEKMKKISKIEGNSVVIPVGEMTDLINFSIYVENAQYIKGEEEKEVFKIQKISEIVDSGISARKTSGINEKTFNREQIKRSIIDFSKGYTEDVFEESEQIVISFY